MAFYEHTFVGKQDLSEKEVENLISKYSKIIDKSGKILKTLAIVMSKGASLRCRAHIYGYLNFFYQNRHCPLSPPPSS